MSSLMFISRILDFIITNVGENQFLWSFHSKDDFIQHQTKCVKEIPEDRIYFYIELIIRIECGVSNIDFRDMEYPTNNPSPITYFYFSKLYPNKLVLVGKKQFITQKQLESKTFAKQKQQKKENMYFKMLQYFCENKEIIVKSCPQGGEWDTMAQYGINDTTGKFDVIIPK
jgi:hypothetical protein